MKNECMIRRLAFVTAICLLLSVWLGASLIPAGRSGVPVQHYLTVNSLYDAPIPTSGWYVDGSLITASVGKTWPGPSNTQYVCTGWTGTGSVPSSGTTSAVAFTITQDSSITWNWKIQYYLTVNDGGHGTASGQYWYDAGSSDPFSIGPTMMAGAAGVRYVFTGWSSSDNGGYTGSASSSSVSMNNPITETATWKTQYYLTIETDPAGIGTIPGTGWYDQGQNVALAAPINLGGYHLIAIPFNWGVDGTAQGVANPITATMNTPHTATAYYVTTSIGGEWAPAKAFLIVSPMNAFELLALAVSLALGITMSIVGIRSKNKG